LGGTNEFAFGVLSGVGSGFGSGTTTGGGLRASSGLATRSTLIALGTGSMDAVAKLSPEPRPITPIATRCTRTDIPIAYKKTLSVFIRF
jgi:hypothetical protein